MLFARLVVKHESTMSEYVVLAFVGSRVGTHKKAGCKSLCDDAGSSQPPVDMKTKVVFYHKGLILKRTFCFDVNRRLETT